MLTSVSPVGANPTNMNNKYQIGDRLPDTQIYIRGIATLSNGKQRYFLQAGNNTFVFEAEGIENLTTLAKYFVQYST